MTKQDGEAMIRKRGTGLQVQVYAGRHRGSRSRTPRGRRLHLGVLTGDVDQSREGRLVGAGDVRPVVVVVMKPGRQCLAALVLGPIAAG